MSAPATQSSPIPPRSIWRFIADRAKRSPAILRLASTLGRGTGRFRLLDHLTRPPPSPAARHAAPSLARLPSPTAIAIGHATVLFRLGHLHILTDPVFSTRIGLGLGLLTAGPARHLRPAIPLHALPPIDALLISHAHFDHLDRPTLRRLAARHPAAAVITSAGCGDLLTDLGFRDVRELAWHDRTTVADLTLTALPVKHWGARVFTDTHRGYCSFLLHHATTRILFAPDTAHFDGWRPLATTGGLDLACIGIGAYDPYIAAHCTPEQAVDMATRAAARAVMPIHHSVFRLSQEPMDEPLRRFRAAADLARIPRVAEEVGSIWHPTA